MIVNGRLTTVVVPRAALDAATEPNKARELTQAVVDYVNNMQRVGVYPRHEMPAEAMQAYHANYYVDQVSNGGHSQFIRNTGVAMLPAASADALGGLEAMGARAQRQILAEMIAWLTANPEQARAQNGSSRVPALDQLDKRFLDAERETPMTPLAARWIARWPDLRPVAGVQYRAELDRLAQLNPQLGPRRVWQGVQQLRFQMKDGLQVRVGVACGAITPEPELKLAIFAGADLEIEGKTCKVFGLRTDKGTRLCTIEDTRARLFELVRPDPPPKTATPEETRKHKPVEAGARLSEVSMDTIRQFAAVAEQTMAAEAIDLLLRKSGIDAGAMITAWKLKDRAAIWIAVSGQKRAAMWTSPDQAAVVGPGGAPTVTVTRAEIERHAAVAADGGASMRPPARAAAKA